MDLAYIDPGTGLVLFSLSGWLFAFVTGVLGFITLFFKRIYRFILRYRWIALSLMIIGGGASLGAVYMENYRVDIGHKVIVLGMDGLSPAILEPMMKRGELPNFKNLSEQGFYTPLKTTNPAQSPVAWASFATGKNPGETGIYDFIQRNPKDYSLKLSLSNIEGGKAKRAYETERFWEMTSKKNIPTTVLGCPVSFPPDKVTGKMLSGMGVPDLLGTEGTFSFYTTKDIGDKKDIGGRVFQVRKSRVMKMDIYGPRKSSLTGKVEQLKVPLKLVMKDDLSFYALVQGQKFVIEKGKWSDWKEVSFKNGFFSKIKGILKFYLVSTEPEFELYVSPINLDPREPLFPISYPSKYSHELAEHLGLYYTQGMPIDTWAVNENRLNESAMLDQANSEFKEKTMMLAFELEKLQNGLLFFYFESPDIIQHMFWRYIDKKHPLYEADADASYPAMIESWYKKMDEVLGRVMERLSPNDTIMVLSDHGFGTFRRAVHINSWLREQGYLELKDKTKKVGGDLLVDVDWKKTRAYALGFGGIYLNLKERERDGIVDVQEAKRLKADIAEKLKLWQDAQHNTAVIRRVFDGNDIFNGAFAKQAPDIFVGFHNGYRASWQTALGGSPEGLLEDNTKKWSGDHLFDPEIVPGIFFMNRTVQNADEMSLYDVAPTILKLVGFEDSEIREKAFAGHPIL